MSDDPKFSKVPKEELEQYVEDSQQRPGESDDDWARRVRDLESDLIRAHKDDPEPTSVKDESEAFPLPEGGQEGTGE